MQNTSQLQAALQNKDAACIKAMRPCVEQFIAALPVDQEDPMLFLIEDGFAEDALMRAFNEKYVANLVKVWGYKALPPLYSMAARHLYEESLPSWGQEQRIQRLFLKREHCLHPDILVSLLATMARSSKSVQSRSIRKTFG